MRRENKAIAGPAAWKPRRKTITPNWGEDNENPANPFGTDDYVGDGLDS